MFQTNPKGLAVKIRAQLGAAIAAACAKSLVPEAFLAGLISVENSRLDPHASRFEKAVFENLKKLRNPLVFWRRSWNSITQGDLRGASDEALVNLATSFGWTQIMGWWSIPLRCTVADIRDPEKHLIVAVNLLHRTAARQLRAAQFGDVLRIWNTGRPDGKTFDPGYPTNALRVMNAYEFLVSPEPTQHKAHGVPASLPLTQPETVSGPAPAAAVLE
jgi:hypothetical protein